MNAESRYVWWPSYRASNIGRADPRLIPTHLLTVGVLTGVLCLPAVTRATGIAVPAVLGLIGSHLVWFVFSALLGRGLTTPRRATLVMAGNLVVNCGVAVAIPIATGDPRTPLWMLPIVYACLNGAMQETEPCIAFLLVHVVSPLLGLILYFGHAPATSWTIAAPVLCAALCGVGYSHLAMVSARWRELRNEQKVALASVHAVMAARDRERLLGDLSDSVGSTFAVVRLYGDLIEAHIDRPDELRTLAVLVREAARSGLDDLRGVLGAMSTAGDDIAGLASTLTQGTARIQQDSPLQVSVAITSGASVRVATPLRLVVVRTFQHEIRDARSRATPSRIAASLASDGRHLTFEIAGAGDDATRDSQILERITELGGTFHRTPATASATTVRVWLPHAGRARV